MISRFFSIGFQLINSIAFLVVFIGIPYFMFSTLKSLERIEKLLIILAENSSDTIE